MAVTDLSLTHKWASRWSCVFIRYNKSSDMKQFLKNTAAFGLFWILLLSCDWRGLGVRRLGLTYCAWAYLVSTRDSTRKKCTWTNNNEIMPHNTQIKSHRAARANQEVKRGHRFENWVILSKPTTYADSCAWLTLKLLHFTKMNLLTRDRSVTIN